MSEVFTIGPEDSIPGFCINEPYASQIYDVCKKLEDEGALSNGATALYWHIVYTIQDHLKLIELNK